MTKVHQVESITFSGDVMKLRTDGRDYRISLVALAAFSDRLLKATPAERAAYAVSPSGYGIHWPLIDEDLTVDGLIRDALPSRKEKQPA